MFQNDLHLFLLTFTISVLDRGATTVTPLPPSCEQNWVVIDSFPKPPVLRIVYDECIYFLNKFFQYMLLLYKLLMYISQFFQSVFFTKSCNILHFMAVIQFWVCFEN